MLWYHKWYNICRYTRFGARAYRKNHCRDFFRREYRIIKIFTGNFHIFNHLNLIPYDTFSHIFSVLSWTNYMIKMLHTFPGGSFFMNSQLWFSFFVRRLPCERLHSQFFNVTPCLVRFCILILTFIAMKWYKHPEQSTSWFDLCLRIYLFITTLPVRITYTR